MHKSHFYWKMTEGGFSLGLAQLLSTCTFSGKHCASGSELMLCPLWSDRMKQERESRKTLHAKKICRSLYFQVVQRENPAMVRITSISMTRETNFCHPFDQYPHTPACTTYLVQLYLHVYETDMTENWHARDEQHKKGKYMQDLLLVLRVMVIMHACVSASL